MAEMRLEVRSVRDHVQTFLFESQRSMMQEAAEKIGALIKAHTDAAKRTSDKRLQRAQAAELLLKQAEQRARLLEHRLSECELDHRRQMDAAAGQLDAALQDARKSKHEAGQAQQQAAASAAEVKVLRKESRRKEHDGASLRDTLVKVSTKNNKK
jgi:hypothetical protein